MKMKKVVILVFMVTMLSALFAELVVNIPFDLDIVGDSYAEVGDYDYESEWIEVTNTGSETQTYTFLYTYENMPDGWNMVTCNDVDTCYMPNFPTPITISAGETLHIHIIVYVRSCAGFNFDFTFSGGDLTEPLIYNFTFNTGDNLGVENHELTNHKLQNFPNPFNNETAINFSLTTENTENAEIEIYNVKGQKVKTFSNLQITNSPNQQITWDASRFAAGVYFYKLNIDGKNSKLNKMILIK